MKDCGPESRNSANKRQRAKIHKLDGYTKFKF